MAVALGVSVGVAVDVSVAVSVGKGVKVEVGVFVSVGEGVDVAVSRVSAWAIAAGVFSSSGGGTGGILTEGIMTGTAVASGWLFTGVGSAAVPTGGEGGVGIAAMGCEGADLRKDRSLLMKKKLKTQKTTKLSSRR